MRRSMGGFLIFSPFHLVQDLVSLVDPRANLLLPSKARRVFEIPDDAPILEMQFRREIELNQHVAETSDIVPAVPREQENRRGQRGLPQYSPPAFCVLERGNSPVYRPVCCSSSHNRRASVGAALFWSLSK